MKLRRLLKGCPLVGLVLCAPAMGAEPFAAFTYEGYDPSERESAVVDSSNWNASERFWPYRVSLTPPASASGEAGAMRLEGVVVHLDSTGRIRVDLGRDGVRTVPLESTDFLARANEVRLGSRTKLAPNFILAYGNRLLDVSNDPIRALRIDSLAGSRFFICLLAHPHDSRLPEWTEATRQLTEAVDGVVAIFFPLPDPVIETTGGLNRLHEADWPGFVMMAQYALPYRLSLWDGDPTQPLLMAFSPERHLLFAQENPDASDWARLVERLSPE